MIKETDVIGPKNCVDWRTYRASVRDLARLSDRELADLGLRRCDIEFVARTAQRNCA